MTKPVRVLIVEDSEDDALLLVRELRRGGYDPAYERIDTTDAMNSALDEDHWDIVVCDYTMPKFSALDALRLLKEKGLDLPFIVVSGTIGEDTAVECMKAGAHDYLMKGNFNRLAPAIERELREARVRRQSRQAEEKYRSIIENAVEGIFQTTPDGRFISANPAMARILGYETAEELMEHIANIGAQLYVTPERREEYIADMRAHEPVPAFESQMYRKDGGKIWVSINARAIYDERGALQFSEGFLQDITGRKRAEEALRESQENFRNLYEQSKQSEELYRSLLDSSPDAVVVYDMEGKAQYVNDSFVGIFGWTMEELKDKRVPFLPESEREATMKMIRRVIDESLPVSGFETKRDTKDGRLLDVSVSASRYHDHQGNPAGMLVILSDITDRKRLEEQLRQATKMEAIGQLAGGIAHDFNNLLTAIMGYSNMLMLETPKDNPRYDKLVQIGRAAERAAELTQQLLAFSRKQVLNVRMLDVNVSIAEFEKMLRRLIGEDIDLVTVLQPTLGRAKADPGQIEQILMNLAVNARDAMPEGGKLTIETSNVVLDDDYTKAHAETDPGLYVMFSVSDTGEGMNAETVPNVFDPFFTTKSKGKGTGLGLSTVYGIVKQHRGHVSVYSEPGLGTTFKVYLPCVEESSGRILKAPAPETRPRGMETVLIVEDDESVRNLTYEALKVLGYTPLAASEPEEALSLCDRYEKTIHLLLTDVVLPQMDGRSLFDRLSPKRPEMKVLYVSGYTDDAIVHHGVLDEGVHFLQKPFTVDSLAGKVRQVLEEP